MHRDVTEDDAPVICPELVSNPVCLSDLDDSLAPYL